MKKPTIHMNGTSRRVLLEQVTNALIAGSEFQTALQALVRHSDADETVRSGYYGRALAMQSVMNELTRLAEHLDAEVTLDVNPTALSGSTVSLLGQLIQTSSAGQKFRNALQEMTPHGRDYYLQGNAAIHEARGEHNQRLQAVQRILDELNTIFRIFDDCESESEQTTSADKSASPRVREAHNILYCRWSNETCERTLIHIAGELPHERISTLLLSLKFRPVQAGDPWNWIAPDGRRLAIRTHYVCQPTDETVESALRSALTGR